MKIAVVGTGYVGLVTGTCFAETGNDVTCIDNNADKVASLQAGKITIFEPGLEVLFDRSREQDRLHFTTSLADGIKDAQIIFLALPTPPGMDGSADLSYILGVAEDLSKIITSYKVIVDKSTVPVGTSEKVRDIMLKNLSPDLFDVVSNPEFLREGVAVEDFMKPDRVVIGVSSPKAQQVMERLYKPFVRQGNPILFMDERSAEMTKYAANAYLAARISFMNEIANLCERTGANVDHVRRGIGSDTRIGKRFLFPGVGYGGSCFPKDVKALIKTSDNNGYSMEVLKAVERVNEHQKTILFEKLKSSLGKLEDRNIAVWGLSFKPETDDMRESTALVMLSLLLKSGCHVRVYDPVAMDECRRRISVIAQDNTNIANFADNIEYCRDMYEATLDADALLLLTEWKEFRLPSWDVISRSMRNQLVLDGRNIFDSEELTDAGFEYHCIGR